MPSEVKTANETRDLAKGRIGPTGGEGENERRVKKQRANNGQGVAGGTMAEKLVFSGDKNVNLKIRR